ncbi:hypothetical protein [Allonocardiopsis opalescens]|uniref:Uncharacterized protein n=1 Tax=Allonocardiopsis opalescens TaxID=1144618 RepID=A0A2T0PVM9_9ACTN|nr:hypothetical protein [Allonocardiopsis opalescens]PRX95595.1 hypothetical protein CLV72_109204 [Allonocardiopsis opalescens]
MTKPYIHTDPDGDTLGVIASASRDGRAYVWIGGGDDPRLEEYVVTVTASTAPRLAEAILTAAGRRDVSLVAGAAYGRMRLTLAALLGESDADVDPTDATHWQRAMTALEELHHRIASRDRELDRLRGALAQAHRAAEDPARCGATWTPLAGGKPWSCTLDAGHTGLHQDDIHIRYGGPAAPVRTPAPGGEG